MMQQERYIPGMYARAWNRLNTGELGKIEVTRGPTGKPEMRIRRKPHPIRLERATDEISIDDMPTVPIRVPKTTERLLPLDSQGRPYLKKAAKDRPLLDVCDEALREYRDLSGEFPAELVLSAFRYLTLDPVSRRFGGYCTFHGDMYIPYTYDAAIRFPDYCVMARGIAKDAWIR